MRTINKRANSTLYDPTAGCSVTLNTLKNYVKDRINFKVVDVVSKEDITARTLLAVLHSLEKTKTMNIDWVKQQIIDYVNIERNS